MARCRLGVNYPEPLATIRPVEYTANGTKYYFIHATGCSRSFEDLVASVQGLHGCDEILEGARAPGGVDEVVLGPVGRVLHGTDGGEGLRIVHSQTTPGHARRPFSVGTARAGDGFDADVAERCGALVQIQPDPAAQVEPGGLPGRGGRADVVLSDLLQGLAVPPGHPGKACLPDALAVPPGPDAGRGDFHFDRPPFPRYPRVTDPGGPEQLRGGKPGLPVHGRPLPGRGVVAGHERHAVRPGHGDLRLE